MFIGNKEPVFIGFWWGIQTHVFHSIANGKRRKCQIEFLETEDGRITQQKDLAQHVEGFYKKLFGPKERCSIRLGDAVW
jgi:hypothetical protein